MSNNRDGILVIVSGPSGVGKSTVVRELIKSCPLPLRLSVSATTRPPRAGETDGVDYHFLTREQFLVRREAGEFIESFEVHGVGYWYGTLKEEVDRGLADGKIVILEIDVNGASQVQARVPGVVSIFVHPANMEELEKRLRGRGSESEERIQRRLLTARAELLEAKKYTFDVVNVTVAATVSEICGILRGLRDPARGCRQP
jgi:guanylate kinase